MLTTALGQNGLFKRAKIAGENYKESEEEETGKITELEKMLDKHGTESEKKYDISRNRSR